MVVLQPILGLIGKRLEREGRKDHHLVPMNSSQVLSVSGEMV